ncbi:MAG: YajQ family cyclic di-GMP-binding protein [Blastocatellia bacterium]
MAQQNTFDVVSKIEIGELKNALDQATKEIGQRYDFKGTNSEIHLDEKENKITLATTNEFTLRSMNDVLQQKLVRRGISLKALSYGKIEPAAKDSVRQVVSLQQGIPIEKAREIVKFIKDSKLKVQASINGDFVRVSGKDRDTLQQVIAALKAHDFGIDMQYTNYRSQ